MLKYLKKYKIYIVIALVVVVFYLHKGKEKFTLPRGGPGSKFSTTMMGGMHEEPEMTIEEIDLKVEELNKNEILRKKPTDIKSAENLTEHLTELKKIHMIFLEMMFELARHKVKKVKEDRDTLLATANNKSILQCIFG